MKRLPIILFWHYCLFSGVTAQRSFSSLSCQNLRTPKIVGGSEADRSEIPFIVSLTRRGGHFCGATIISERWLLTAGHCVCNGLNKIMKPSQIKGVLGLHSLSEHLNGIQDRQIVVDLVRVVPHSGYSCNSVKNDIALLEMSTTIAFTDQIKPTCLSVEDDEHGLEKTFGTVSGWGWTDESRGTGTRSNVLRKAMVQIWNNDECQKSYQLNGKRSNFIAETQMCAGFTYGGVDACWADSGGPLVTKNNVLIGIVSTGIGCGRPGLPGIYTRVAKYISWVENVLEY